jgi:hypothetical protein
MNRKPRAGRWLAGSVFAFAVIVLCSGCDLYGTVGVDDTNIEGAFPEALLGQWAFTPSGSPVPAELYTIAKDSTGYTITYGYGGGSSPFDYAGTVEFVSNYSSDSGLIIIKYTTKPTFTSPTKYNEKDYFAIYYRKLHSTWVQLANTTVLPVSTAVTSPDVDTRDEAIEKFTRMRMGLYVDWGVVQPQIRVGQ